VKTSNLTEERVVFACWWLYSYYRMALLDIVVDGSSLEYP
jgi:hypothetical protein